MWRKESGRSFVFIVIVCVLFVFLNAAGQQGLGKGRLAGDVKDEEGKPIAGAKLVARFLGKGGATFETTSDKKGLWSFLGLGTGKWNIMASADGCHSANRDCFVHQLVANPSVPLVLAKILSGTTDKDPAGFLDKANGFFFLKKYAEAAAAYQEFLQKNPGDIMVRLSIGDCYRESGEFLKAMDEFGRVVEMTKKDPLSKALTARGLTGLGECQFKLGDLEKAEFYFRSSLEMFPEDEVVAYNLGEVCSSLRKFDEAIRAYEKATQVSPYWSDPLFKLGYAYLSLSKYEKAKETLQKFLTLEPNGSRAVKAKKTIAEIEKIK